MSVESSAQCWYGTSDKEEKAAVLAWCAYCFMLWNGHTASVTCLARAGHTKGRHASMMPGLVDAAGLSAALRGGCRF